MAEPLLEVSDLSVRFDTDDGIVHAVDKMSFSLAPGEVLGIVGESGCGKSVTCMSLTRLLPETATVTGSAVFGGRDLLTLAPRSLRRVRGREISYVFQEPMTSLNPVFTVGHQIDEVLRRHLDLSRRAARARALELLRLVRIPAPERRLDIRDRLGTAIVLITHNLGVVADVADRVVVMYAGRKAEEASVDDLFAHPQHPYTIGLLGAIPRPYEGEDTRRRLQEIPGRVPSLRELPNACAFADRCPRADELTRSEIPQLREVRPKHWVACFHPGS
jgi:peptide/nickel transport system ATP-binding protein